MKAHKKQINNWVVISDLHCGSRLGLYAGGFHPDQGGEVLPSRQQNIIWSWWQEMWNEWVPEATKGEPYGVVLNGDGLDGVPHGATSVISANLSDQAKIATTVLKPVVESCEGRFIWIRGTEAHVDKSGSSEESVAKALNAIPDRDGAFSRFDLWLRVGNGLCHLLHHIGTTASSAHETSSVNAELTAEYNESSRWGERPPDIIIRSHRHRYSKVEIPTRNNFAIAAVTPGWQLKTPFSFRIAGARLAPPQFGAILIRQGDRRLYTEPWVKHLKRDQPVEVFL